jgi:hypothetical protein
MGFFGMSHGHGSNGSGNGNGSSDNPSLEELVWAVDHPGPDVDLEQIPLEIDPNPALENDFLADYEDDEVTDPDPLSSWKRRDPSRPVTLEQLHSGLIATYEYSKVAIEGHIQMAADVRDVVSAVDVRTQQIDGLSAKVESVTVFVHQIDTETAKTSKMLEGVRRDVQFLKDDVREIKVSSAEAARQLPVIKDMLGEILARLPDPGTHRK